jgi:hypothetical protein
VPLLVLERQCVRWSREPPVIVYRAVSKYARDELRAWLAAQDPYQVMTILVGASSSTATVRTSLRDAQALRRQVNPEMCRVA